MYALENFDALCSSGEAVTKTNLKGGVGWEGCRLADPVWDPAF